LLVGLTGCGPGGSGNSPTLEARASAAKAAATSLSTQENGASSASGKETVPAGGNPQSKSAGTPNNAIETVEDKLITSIESKKSAALPLPDSIAADLASPHINIRLKALDYWAKQGTKAPLDPLLEALEDDDAEVRTKAAKIAEEQWGIKQEQEQD